MPSIADDARKLFQAELDAEEGTGAKSKLCREVLSTPQRMDHFRKIAAMDFLVEMLGPDALEDLLPYLGHDSWRLREHSRKLASELVTVGAGDLLASHFAKVDDANTQSGILAVFSSSSDDAGLPLARQALSHEKPSVRHAALNTLAALGGEEALPEVLDHLKNASTPEDRIGCEEALLLLKNTEYPTRPNPRGTRRTNAGCRISISAVRSIILSPGSAMRNRSTALRNAAETDDFRELEDIVFALSYSPNRKADQVYWIWRRATKRSQKS